MDSARRSDNTIDEAVADAAALVRAATVDIRVGEQGGGSGIVWNRDGLVITNAHVARSDRAIVQLASGETIGAQLVARDELRDLAALQVAGGSFTSALLAEDAPLRAGQFVLAVGSPHGVQGAVAVGIVHSIDRGTDGEADFIHTTVRLSPGNSGGPLADVQGRVHGVNSMIVNGVGVARGITSVHRFLRRANGQHVLGVSLRPVAVRRHGAVAAALLVLDVANESVAARAGLAIGDVLLSVDGAPVRNAMTLIDRLDSLARDQSLRIDVGRAGHVRDVLVSFGREPSRAA